MPKQNFIWKTNGLDVNVKRALISIQNKGLGAFQTYWSEADTIPLWGKTPFLRLIFWFHLESVLHSSLFVLQKVTSIIKFMITIFLVGWWLLIAHLDDLCIYHWLFVLIIIQTERRVQHCTRWSSNLFVMLPFNMQANHFMANGAGVCDDITFQSILHQQAYTLGKSNPW